MVYDAIVVGGGIAGLTSAAYLTKAGYRVLLCEQHETVGGLVNSFQYKGFTFDGGIRAIENSGIVRPCLEELDIEVEFLENVVSIGMADELIKITSSESLAEYEQLLKSKFPDESSNITKIILEIKKIMGYMDVLYGIKNPLFLDIKKHQTYYQKVIMPWLFKYLVTSRKINQLQTPVNTYLREFTSNETLISLITQHFFHETPASFALSYFSLYLDYSYPKGGTGTLIEALKTHSLERGATIQTKTAICEIDITNQKLTDQHGKTYHYQTLIWAADQKALYQQLKLESFNRPKIRRNIQKRQAFIQNKQGNDSVLSLYVTVNLSPDYFKACCSAHTFYTPRLAGLSSLIETLHDVSHRLTDVAEIYNWLRQYYEYTTYEISIPVLRDQTLAPPEKTGLIISTLMDYELVKKLEVQGEYDAFKELSATCILDVLEKTLFKDINLDVEDQFVSTPITMTRYTKNTEGAITGWSFTNDKNPAVQNMTKVASSVLTPIPNVYQAGQWTFSPSGLPISILTAKLAATKAIKQLSRKKD